MPEQKIYCSGCSTYLGIIRDAKLRKGIVFLCKNCGTKRVALEMQRKTGGSGMDELFGALFKK
jgi:RNase P subunit RPR2